MKVTLSNYSDKLAALPDFLLVPVETTEERFTGRLRWGKDGTLQQEVQTISYPTHSVRSGWRMVPTEE